MFKTASLVFVNDGTLEKKSTNIVHEFLVTHLTLLKYDVEKLVLTTDDEKFVASQLNELSKQYDILLVLGDNNTILKALARLCDEDLSLTEKVEPKHKCVCDLPSKAKLLTSNTLTYPVIYFQRIFILKEESAKDQFKEVLKSHLEQYIAPPLYKKFIQAYTNGNTKSVIDSIQDLVSVNVHKEQDFVTLEVSSEQLTNVVEVEQILASRLNRQFLYSYWDQESLKKVLDSGDQHIVKSLEVIERCMATYGPDNTFLSFNGGKDCTVLLHLVYAFLQVNYPDYKKQIFCLYVQGKEPFPEQEEFISLCQIYYNLDIMVVKSGIKDALQEVLTTRPNLKACFMGTRRTDPYSEHLDDMQLYCLCSEPSIGRSIKIKGLRWLGHLERTNEMEPSKHIYNQRTDGVRRKGRSRAQFKDQVEYDIRVLRVRY
ncbi:FAD synthase isoform X1 [Diabrotica virgifera virgifera]|uniref:FAD synthase n=1 Tax=Diabrotica virgifera virgifera TaxID=50390 RepID=A0ABM5K3Z6_DIAVI|nr:FAD synthase isoform X1 [Diabrotica virgifera virgifera]